MGIENALIWAANSPQYKQNVQVQHSRSKPMEHAHLRLSSGKSDPLGRKVGYGDLCLPRSGIIHRALGRAVNRKLAFAGTGVLEKRVGLLSTFEVRIGENKPISLNRCGDN